jgi:hypothetical protein
MIAAMHHTTWHVQARNRAEAIITSGVFGLRIPDGYVCSTHVSYNVLTVEYDVLFRLFRSEHNQSEEGVFMSLALEHVERVCDFPSDHLKTKIMLIAS